MNFTRMNIPLYKSKAFLDDFAPDTGLPARN